MQKIVKISLSLMQISALLIFGLFSLLWQEGKNGGKNFFFFLRNTKKAILSVAQTNFKINPAFAQVNQRQEKVIVSVVKKETIHESVRKAVALAE
ncbi:hypothetical protein IBX65_02525 [Candidatus Aerophobetes bacterium]|nr:hypothetical protein [Candidatus Aerophobetes bacterium]